ncbi:MAG: hypothetical protein H0T46_12935 [Deltaproteobacteria bacterium]|nr:hypothetical protein [Deltaproteobacteria bacterium]
MIHEDHEATSGPGQTAQWTQLFQAFSEAFEWALDLAGGLARTYPDEVAAVERVRTFTRRRVAGEPAHIRVDDLLFTFGLIAGALERDVRPLLTPARVEAAVGTPAPGRLPASTRSPNKPARTLKARRGPRSAPDRGAHAVRASAPMSRSRGAAAVARDRWVH